MNIFLLIGTAVKTKLVSGFYNLAVQFVSIIAVNPNLNYIRQAPFYKVSSFSQNKIT